MPSLDDYIITGKDRQMTTTISQVEINALARKTCDTFRGVVDPSNFLLFSSFVSSFSQSKKRDYFY